MLKQNTLIITALFLSCLGLSSVSSAAEKQSEDDHRHAQKEHASHERDHEHSSLDHKRVQVAIAKLQMLLAEHELAIARHEEAIAEHEKKIDAHEKGDTSHDHGDTHVKSNNKHAEMSGQHKKMHARHAEVMKIVEAIEKLDYEKSYDDHTVDNHKEHDHDKHEEHGSHEHGAAQLTMAVGNGVLEVELETPAANVFGFEYKATSDEDKKTLVDNKAKLEQVAALFAINKEAGCEPANTEVKSALFEDHEDHKNEKHEGETHNDVEAHWTFKCKNTKEIHDVDVKLFSAFPKGFDQIKVDWVTPTKASTVTLKQDTTVELH